MPSRKDWKILIAYKPTLVSQLLKSFFSSINTMKSLLLEHSKLITDAHYQQRITDDELNISCIEQVQRNC